jgi:hypothetical protein
MRTTSLLFSAILLGVAGDAAAFKCLPMYGNWCGIGHPSHGAPPPVDAFDAACMRHDLCVASTPYDTPCDIAFVNELHAVAAQVGGMPRALQWAEYAIRVKAGGPTLTGMPMPMPWDAMGAMSILTAPCW